jgi:hypothetical protein
MSSPDRALISEAIAELNNLAVQVQEAQKTSANIGTMLPL